ncbi:hypothetical protein Ddc_11609 [Ditylenchus destructor]|nr:hypothetical protein Ddc_11609 [Ditylenchus destructor]
MPIGIHPHLKMWMTGIKTLARYQNPHHQFSLSICNTLMSQIALVSSVSCHTTALFFAQLADAGHIGCLVRGIDQLPPTIPIPDSLLSATIKRRHIAKLHK